MWELGWIRIYEDAGGNMRRPRGLADLVETVAEYLKDYMVTLEEHRAMFKTDDEQKKYGLVLKCVEQLWNGREGWDASDRKFLTVWRKLEMTPKDAEKRIRENLRPWLQEAWDMHGQGWWSTQDINTIGNFVNQWFGEETQASEAAPAASAPTPLLDKTAQKPKETDTITTGGSSRAVEPDTTLTIILTTQKREALRKVVEDMKSNILILKTELDEMREDPHLKYLIANVMTYQQSCNGENTWVWNTEAWEAANEKLKSCQLYWTKLCNADAPLSNFRLKSECETCMRDMLEYQ